MSLAASQREALNVQMEEKRMLRDMEEQAKAAERLKIKEQVAAYKVRTVWISTDTLLAKGCS